MRPIGEVAESLGLPQHVLRFWETRFKQINPFKRAGGRRLYRPRDIELVAAIRHLLYNEGYTIRGVQRILKEQGVDAVVADVNRRISGDAEELAVEPTAAPEPIRREPTIEIPAPSTGESVDAPNFVEAPDAERRPPSPLDHVPPIFIGRGAEPDFSAAAPPALREEEARLLREALAEIEECQRLLKLTQP